MPKNMTAAEYDEALREMDAMLPPPAGKEDIDQAFVPTSFNLSAGGSVLVLRLVNKRGEVLDLNLSQAISVEMLGTMAKSLHAIDWMDSAGKPQLDPAAS